MPVPENTNFFPGAPGAHTGALFKNIGAYYRNPSALQDLASTIVNTHFPALLEKSSASVTSIDKLGAPPYALGAFNPRTNTLAIRAPAQTAANFTTTKTGAVASQDISFNLADVMDTVTNILHEASHAKKNSSKLADDNALLKDFAAAGVSPKELQQAAKNLSNPFDAPLYSITPEKLNLTEFLANADALLSMKAKNLVPDNSVTAAQLGTLEKVLNANPRLKAATTAALEKQSQPQVDILDTIKSFFIGGAK